MALANYTDLVTNVGIWLARSGDSNITAYAPDFVALFEAEFNQDPDSRYRQMETTTSLTPSSGVATLPTDFLEVRAVKWTGTPARDLEYVTPSYMTARWPDAPSDNPQAYTIVGGNLNVMPLSNTALTFDYWQKLPSLQTGTTNWLMTAYPNIYLAGTMVEAYAFIQDAEKAVAWKERMSNGLGKLTKSAFNAHGRMAQRVMGPTP